MGNNTIIVITVIIIFSDNYIVEIFITVIIEIHDNRDYIVNIVNIVTIIHLITEKITIFTCNVHI